MSVQNEKDNHYLLKNWRPENKAFWEKQGPGYCEKKLMDISNLLTTGLLRLDVIQRRGGQS